MTAAFRQTVYKNDNRKKNIAHEITASLRESLSSRQEEKEIMVKASLIKIRRVCHNGTESV